MKRIALVTGGGAGIGRACAVRLANDGRGVGVLDLDGAAAESVAAEIRAMGGQAIGVQADISDRAQVVAALAEVRAALGPVTILVNNAAIADFVPFDQITEDQWDTMFRINAKGTFIVTQVVLPDMKVAEWGRIINISSSSAQQGAGNMVHYAASKGAIIAFTRSLALALGPHGITVNNIPPSSVMGTIMSEANKHRFAVSPDDRKKSVPVRRNGIPEDIACACSFLAAEDAGYVTGQTIGVNGGMVLS